MSLDAVDTQEAAFATAFGAGDISLARHLYAPDVIYSSPTTRLFGWPRHIEGVERTLEFIQLTIAGCRAIDYRPLERARLDSGGAFVLVEFDWDDEHAGRLRSRYAIVYRYRDGLIAAQELFYDPSDVFTHPG